MEKSRAIELLKLAVPIKALTQQEYADFVEAVNMGMDALKAQLSKEGTTKGTTSDLISKTKTVERLRGVLEITVPITDHDGGYIDGIETGISIVSTMPTVQPQSTTGQLNDGAQSTAQSTDLIDRQAAIDAAESAYVRNMFPTPLIREVPTVEPERKKGEWLPDNNNAYEMRFVCSCCKESEVVPTIGFTKYKPLWDFCPNCGADMRGEKDG